MNIIINSDCIEGLRTLPDKCVHTCVTSPPYFGLRDYGQDGQIGLEEKPDQFVQKLVEVFREVRRVLRDDGTVWLNLGDSYNGSGGAGGDYSKGGLKEGQPKYPGRKLLGLKPKDLIGIPWRVAFALQTDGWYLRQDIIWHKPNPMPESVTDRCTKAHEYIFLLSKSQRYYFDADAIKEEAVWDVDGSGTDARIGRADESHKAMPTKLKNGIRPRKSVERGAFNGKTNELKGREAFRAIRTTRNRRSVWTVTTKPYSGAHFATFPQDLIVDCIKAGCPENGLVLDPFMGAGTTALVARKLNRNYIGTELNSDYVKIAEQRLVDELGMFT